MRTGKSGKSGRAGWLLRFMGLLLPVLPVFPALPACARMEPPPGGPPDAAPPRLVATRPDSLAVLRPFRGVAEFQFDEVISEGGAPSRGEGTGGLERLVILSPATRVPEVNWRRSRITVRPREGWQPNRVYRVELLPGVTDLRNNRSENGAVITFTTGAPRPQTTLQGRVLDWTSGRPSPGALVIATLLPDSLPYRGIADSSGRFALGPLPQGEYLVAGVLDQNGDRRQDQREAYATVRLPRSRTDAGELWAFVHDTTPPRIQAVTVNDSVSATIAFTQRLDPGQRLTPREIRLRLLPDSTPYPVASILPQPMDDSLRARTDTARARAPAAPPRRGLPEAEEPPPSRPPLFDRLVLRVPKPWPPGARLVLELRGVRNVTGVAGNAMGVVAVPEKPKEPPKDTTAPRQPRDTAAARKPAPPPADRQRR